MTTPTDYQQICWPDHYGSSRLTRVHLFPEERQVSLCGRGLPWYYLLSDRPWTNPRSPMVEDFSRRHQEDEICRHCWQILARNNR